MVHFLDLFLIISMFQTIWNKSVAYQCSRKIPKPKWTKKQMEMGTNLEDCQNFFEHLFWLDLDTKQMDKFLVDLVNKLSMI